VGLDPSLCRGRARRSEPVSMGHTRSSASSVIPPLSPPGVNPNPRHWLVGVGEHRRQFFGARVTNLHVPGRWEMVGASAAKQCLL